LYSNVDLKYLFKSSWSPNYQHGHQYNTLYTSVYYLDFKYLIKSFSSHDHQYSSIPYTSLCKGLTRNIQQVILITYDYHMVITVMYYNRLVLGNVQLGILLYHSLYQCHIFITSSFLIIYHAWDTAATKWTWYTIIMSSIIISIHLTPYLIPSIIYLYSTIHCYKWIHGIVTIITIYYIIIQIYTIIQQTHIRIIIRSIHNITTNTIIK
jgi:hypothetical protein